LTLRQRKWQIPPYKVYKNVSNPNDIISTRRGCHNCPNGPYNESGFLEKSGGGRCCWEWCKTPVRVGNAYTECQDCIEGSECNDFMLETVQEASEPPDPIHVCYGWRIHIRLQNIQSFEEDEGHPFHLHGHKFQVVRLQPLNGSTSLQLIGKEIIDGPLMDTVWVPFSTAVTIAFDAINPGRWLLHCHNHFHLENGMATAVIYDSCDDVYDNLTRPSIGDAGDPPVRLCGTTGCNLDIASITLNTTSLI